jgi:hypothetical protein
MSEMIKRVAKAIRDTNANTAGLKATGIDACREELRLLMLRQPITGERNTYSDGFFQGLAEAIRQIDAALK